MRVIVTGRQMGKTTALIKEMANNPGSVMICSAHHMVVYAEQAAKQHFPEIKWVGRFMEFPSNGRETHRLRGASKVYVDDLDLLLQSLLRGPVEIVTVTAELVDEDEVQRQYLRELLEEQQRG